MSDGQKARSNQVEPAATFVQDISSVDGVNEGTRRLNSILNELRRRGHGDVRVAVVGDEDDD